jgi:putative ABC transport system permease protein
MVVSDDLLLRLGVNSGAVLTLGDAEFRVAAIVAVEPDRMTGSMNVGPRVMISREGLERSGLIQPGSRAAQRYLLRLPPEGPSIAQVRPEVEKVFFGARIADFRETHPTIERGLSRATNFLSLVCLIALIVGALGVAMAIHSHLEQRLDTIAIMKCLGARSGQIIRIYLLQTLLLGLLGSSAGLVIGYGIQAWFPTLIANYFPTAPDLDWQPISALQGLIVGALTTLLFTVPPLLGIRRVRPALIFRRDVDPAKGGLWSRLRDNRASVAAAAGIVFAISAVAAWLAESVRLGAWFAGGLLVSVAVLSVMASLLLRLMRGLPRALRRRLPASVRQGVANLHRPGTHAAAVVVALGIGVTFTLSIYLLQTSVLQQMVRSAPPDMPNLFFINVTDRDRDGVMAMLNSHAGIEGTVELVPSLAARLVSVDGVPVEDLADERAGPRFQRVRTITWRETPPENAEIIEGAWWDRPEQLEQNLVSAQEWAAETLGLRLGSQLEWTVGGQSVTALVVAIHRSESFRPGSTIDFILTPRALAGLPTSYYGSARIAPDLATGLQREAFEKFPGISVINVADVLAIVQEVVDQIGVVIRFISAFAILGGIVILVSSVMATRFRRIQEVAILKTLGATRRQVSSIFSVEFLVLGVTAGAMGTLLASGFSSLLLEQVLDAEYRFDLWPNVICVLGTALLANLAGWLASFRILGQKPLAVLRGE